ncbi:MAG: hypothetical protein WDA02_02230 [Saccharofermentanales bacterium]
MKNIKNYESFLNEGIFKRKNTTDTIQNEEKSMNDQEIFDTIATEIMDNFNHNNLIYDNKSQNYIYQLDGDEIEFLIYPVKNLTSFSINGIWYNKFIDRGKILAEFLVSKHKEFLSKSYKKNQEIYDNIISDIKKDFDESKFDKKDGIYIYDDIEFGYTTFGYTKFGQLSSKNKVKIINFSTDGENFKRIKNDRGFGEFLKNKYSNK